MFLHVWVSWANLYKDIALMTLSEVDRRNRSRASDLDNNLLQLGIILVYSCSSWELVEYQCGFTPVVVLIIESDKVVITWLSDVHQSLQLEYWIGQTLDSIALPQSPCYKKALAIHSQS